MRLDEMTASRVPLSPGVLIFTLLYLTFLIIAFPDSDASRKIQSLAEQESNQERGEANRPLAVRRVGEIQRGLYSY